ncbi:hypothetical protein Q5P01_004357 [Channa striata]|uniref:Uncharacterized protein n=1 Tax=Channa striata TaxID=64152 RepID=A0AA88NL81_CHASR|nr:hypothetical protein Q5P01_004357 [Channa striata]
MMLQKKDHGNRLYNKKSYCVFCSSPVIKMARHFVAKHKDKPEVAKAIASPVGSKERKIQLNLLRNKGNHAHNNLVLREGKGMLIPSQQPSKPHGHDLTKHEYIRQKMQETGQLVLQGQKNGNLKTIVAGLNEETNTYKTPSLALKLGHNLKNIANVLESEAMISGDETTINNVRAFKQICNNKWSECVSSKALRNLSEAKWNTPQLLPFAEDVRKMHQHLTIQRTQCQSKLQEEPSKKHWAELAKITLCEVILFNRRREGEVSKMSLNAFMLRDTSSTHPDVELVLSDLEKKLFEHFQRIEIKWKQGRKVPILITPDMLESMELLVKTRCKFMFARPQALSHFRGSDVICQVARSCEANHPEALSSTKLRKHMATMSKVLNLKDNEMDDLGDFLGHDIRVHRQYYRLPEGTLQLAKISKVLMAQERGQLHQFKGKNLDEISIDPQVLLLCANLSVWLSDSEDEDEVTVKDTPSGSPSSSQSSMSSQPKRRKWTEEETQACLKCIETSPAALKGRSWEAVKFYVKNRIDALKQENLKR